MNGENRLDMFNIGKSLVVRALNWQLPSFAVLTKSQVQSSMNSSSMIKKPYQQINRNEYHNTCHKRLSSGNGHSQSSSVNSMKRLAGKVAVVTASTDG